MHRRIILRWIPVAALVFTSLFATAALPSTAAAEAVAVCPEMVYPKPAYCNDRPPVTAGPNHIGWTYLNLNYCPPGYACGAVFTFSKAAWSWNGYAWHHASLDQGWVYVYPYTGSWRWAWTQKSGWVAVSGGRFELTHNAYL